MRRNRETVFRRVTEHGASRPSFGAVSLLLGALSVAALATWIVLPAAAVWLLVRHGPTAWTLLASALLLLVAFVLRPRASRLGVISEARPRTHPRLFSLLGDVAREIGTEPPTRVLLSTEPSAWACHGGVRGRRTLVLGLPLLLPLDGQACVALIGHEIAHFENGDVTRGRLGGGAIETVARWCDLLIPHRPDESGSGLAHAAAAVILRGFALLPQGLLALMVHLAWRRSQEAEYHADRLAARVAGTDATLTLLEHTLDRSALDMALHRIVVGGSGKPLAEEMGRHLAARPPREPMSRSCAGDAAKTARAERSATAG
jgi:Zn-dependent protease with chaperone function